ncbi:uncharacterized protein [Eucyclogobius newberryi]|uniref:uncharacterized protein n=1 Tax=Eucyclogobius newberryi TaxID=166745 RepID=UPI003B5B2784
MNQEPTDGNVPEDVSPNPQVAEEDIMHVEPVEVSREDLEANYGDSFINNDTKVKDFTGLPSFALLRTIVTNLIPFLREKSVLTPFQQVLLVCMKLRLDLNMQFQAYLFGVSRSTVSRIFNDVLHAVGGKEVTRVARAATAALIGDYSSGYKLIISKGWGGLVNDKHITNNCGFNNVLPGDVIFADRGFDVGDSVGLYNCTLKIPAFTRGKKQLDPLDVESTPCPGFSDNSC